MRVKRTLDIAALLRITQMERIEDIDDKAALVAPEPPEEPDEIRNNEIFYMLAPGTERVCVVLRADGLTYSVIGEIMGLSEKEVKDIMKTAKAKVYERLHNL